jgi:predicted DNA-binding protein with PD1-like motif
MKRFLFLVVAISLLILPVMAHAIEMPDLSIDGYLLYNTQNDTTTAAPGISAGVFTAFNQIIEGIRTQPVRSLQNSWTSIQQLLHKANTDMMSENYLSRIIPSLEGTPDGDLKEMLKGLHSYIETIGQRGADSQGLLAAQLAAVLLLDERFVLEMTQSAQNGTRVDFEAAARRALENVRTRFADTKSFNGKTIMTSLEVMLQSASEPKPHMHVANNFANGTDLGAQSLINGILFKRELPAEQMANLENIPLNELLRLLDLRIDLIYSTGISHSLLLVAVLTGLLMRAQQSERVSLHLFLVICAGRCGERVRPLFLLLLLWLRVVVSLVCILLI